MDTAGDAATSPDGGRPWPPPDYRNQWDLLEVHCQDLHLAARHASRRNWWLHCWEHVQAEHDSPTVVIVGGSCLGASRDCGVVSADGI